MAKLEREGQKPFEVASDPFVVAERLKRAKVMVGTSTVVLTGAKGFTRQENEKGIYKTMLRETAGNVRVLNYRGFPLPLLSTSDGSCVMISDAEMEVEGKIKKLKGPKAVAEALGVTIGDERQMVLQDEGEVLTFQLIDPNAKGAHTTKSTTVFEDR